MRWLRLLKIISVSLRFGLDQMLLDAGSKLRFAGLFRVTRLGRRLDAPRAVRLRQALEALGPIFVKFGQMLSTRRDLLPPDIADELARLQDQVPPFPSAEAIAELERVYGKPVDQVFASFEREPVASASIAQVHFAVLREEDGGHEVAVKILRPGVKSIIVHDIGLLQAGAAPEATTSAEPKPTMDSMPSLEESLRGRRRRPGRQRPPHPGPDQARPRRPTRRARPSNGR